MMSFSLSAVRRWRPKPSDLIAWVALAAIAVIAVRHATMYRGLTIDDAFITFRHSRNLAHGDGPVYNAGEHVEGTSSFLQMLLLGLATAVGCDTLSAAKALGVASLVALVVLAFATVRRLLPRGGRFFGLLASAMVAASTPLAVFSESGLETTLYSALLCGAVFALVQPSSDPARPWWAALMGLAAATRPEGMAFFLLLWGLELARALVAGGTTWRRSLTALAWFGALFGPVIVFRLLYYHAWIPNSVLAKSGRAERFVAAHGLGALVQAALDGDGAKQVKEYLTHLGLAAPLLVCGIAAKRTSFATLVCLAIGASCGAVAVWNDGDWMGHFRLLAPAIAPLAIAIALGLGALTYRIPAPRLREKVAAAIPALAVTASAIDGTYYEREYSVPQDARHYLDWLGKELAKVRRSDDSMATDMAGILPFASGMTTIDMFGLCDGYIARHGVRYGVMGKVDWDYVIRRRPTFYLFNFTSWVADLYRKPAFTDQRNEYWAVITPMYRAYNGGDRKLLLVRRDRPDLDVLTKALNATLVDPRDELHRLGQW
jgi:hypothetical protein